MAVTIIDEKEDARLIKMTDGEKIKLEVDGELTIKVVSITRKKVIGQFDFRLIEDGFSEYYKLTYMFLEGELGYTGKGIGEACIQYCLDYSDLPIYCGQAVGEQADDGSHLTGSGESFAMKMIDKGLISGQV
ncbi:hypothetical protein [Photobacterium leiognathi]|uniref:hypothetical protein n=1 Tax=Photobacterium leiognathi TaxID=553611 RepID=UPI002980E899|nr:hypothetical protein [Photobacterium leiognathi]